MTAVQLGYEIMRLECKSRLSLADYRQLDELKRGQRNAQDREAAAMPIAA